MGLNISDIVQRKEISLSDLSGKIIVVDAFNTIYQFLSTIRQPDGTSLMDSKRRITSHLSGLFYRNTNLMTQGIRLIYVFDGESPKLKAATNKARQETKEEAREKFERAKAAGEIEEMGRYAKQLTALNEEMIEESKQLLHALGIPVIQAPSEGEAQASYMCGHDKNIYAVGSQDYDSLLFNSPRLVQNLTLARKRRLASGAFVPIQPELIELERVLNSLQINHQQIICLGILVGTDYNPGGIRGIGPKKALALVRQYKQPALLFNSIQKNIELDFNWQDIFELFMKPQIITDYKIEFSDINHEMLKKILCNEHNFSAERVDNAIDKLEKQKEELKQSDLKKWF